MSNNSIKASVFKGISNVLDITNKIVPINRIPSVYCFSRWVDSNYQLNHDPVSYVYADYYNGYENDLVNIFMEVLALVNGDHCYNGNYILMRLEFLANEGLNILDVHDFNAKSFKISPQEADEVIKTLAKKTKKVSKAEVKKNIKNAVKNYNKKVKSSVGLKKPKKKLRRDNKGRFINNK